MLGADDVMAQLAGRLARELDDALGAGREGELAEGHGGGGRGRDELLDLLADALQVDVEVLQDLGGDAAAFLDDSQEDVLRPDELAVEPLGFLSRQAHDLASALGEFLEHRRASPLESLPFASIVDGLQG